MADQSGSEGGAPEIFGEMRRGRGDAVAQAYGTLFGQLSAGAGDNATQAGDVHWAEVVQRLQAMWLDFQADQLNRVAKPPAHHTDPAKLISLVESWYRQMPFGQPEIQKRLW